MIHVQDKRLLLPDGRRLAYADNGNTSSSILVLHCHGAFSVGDASHLSPILQSNNVHLVCPSLPGWGASSPVPDPSHYASTITSDMTALLSHLHPELSKLKLYICGHSFGCVTAQILYGSSYTLFPYGRCIAGLILLAPLSPPHCHKEYSRLLSWEGYFLTGPPSRYLPFNLVARLAKLSMASKLQTEVGTDCLTCAKMFNSADEHETESFARWKEENDVEDGQLERETFRNAVQSVAVTWQGFMDVSQIYHSGWGGFCPNNLDEDHSRPPVIIVTSQSDDQSPMGMGEWLAREYRHATLKVVSGGQLSVLLHADNAWKELLS